MFVRIYSLMRDQTHRKRTFFVFFLFIFFILVATVVQSRNNYNVKGVTLKELESKKESSYIIYFARNDCPECKKTDRYLRKNISKFDQNIYRIETKSEPNQEQLNIILSQQKIQTVPTFLQKQNEKYSKVTLKIEQKKSGFQFVTSS